MKTSKLVAREPLARLRNVAVTGLVATTTLALVACGASSDGEGTGADEAASDEFASVTPNVLTVATQVGSPGTMEGTDPENLTGGTEWELAHALAEGMGFDEVKFINVGFTQLIAGSLTGYDVGIFGIFKTAEREAVNTYSDCYAQGYAGALVREGHEVKTAEDAKQQQWGYITGTFQGLIMEKIDPEVEAKAYPDSPTLYSALESRKVDAILADLSHMVGEEGLAEQMGDVHVAGIVESESVPTPCSAVQLPKDAPKKNVDLVNGVINEVTTSGQWEAWVEEYQGYDPEDYPSITVE